MNLTDSHCHLYLPEFDADRSEMIDRAISAGVHRFYLPNVDASTIDSMLALSASYPGHCFPMMGLHPCSVRADWKKELEIVKKYLFEQPEQRFNGIGETGLDFYWDMTYKEEQIENFKQHIDWAKTLELPIIIHSRDATEACIQMIEDNASAHLRGIFHCFSGTMEQAKRVIDLGFYLGIGGVVTFKNGGLDKIVEALDLNHIVLETDSPYLAPVPYRGKRNESSYLSIIAGKIAQLKNIQVEEVATITTANAKQLFQG